MCILPRCSLFFVTFQLIAVLLKAQVTITIDDMPSVGDTAILSRSLANIGMNWNETGQNFHWDYSSLSPQRQEISRYQSVTQTPYFFYFLNFTTYGTKIIDSIGLQQFSIKNIYNFYQKKNNTFSAVGIGASVQGFPLGAKHSDPDDIFYLPLYYGMPPQSNTFKFKLGVGDSIGWAASGTRSTVVDGWGTITTPYGTFPCIRVKSTITETDTITFQGFKIPIPRNQIELRWMSPGYKIPILQVNGTQFLTTTTFTDVIYLDLDRRPVAAFSADIRTGCRPMSVQFANNSERTTQNTWDFGDGNTSTQANPTHTYTEAGAYNVKLIARNSLGVDSVIQNQYIYVIGAEIKITSTKDTVTMANPVVSFYNVSYYPSGQYTWLWDFGDGYFSNQYHSSHYYRKPGVYEVTLYSTNSHGCKDTLFPKKIIVVQEVTAIDLPEWAQGCVIFPNPSFSQQAYLKLGQPTLREATIHILSITGQTIETITVSSGESQIQLPNLASGMYFVIIEQDSRILFREKWVVSNP
ncbi:MAG: PKD domain-containing protein [Bacteroidia bacterium]|nr:PKD domain-containing protein [Bacteroidia bacterium]